MGTGHQRTPRSRLELTIPVSDHAVGLTVTGDIDIATVNQLDLSLHILWPNPA